MKVLVAGGAGFLGSHLCDALLHRGDEVVCVDNYVTGSRCNIRHLATHDRFTSIDADVAAMVLDPEQTGGPVDAVMHLASPASPAHFIDLAIETLDAGSLGTRNLLEVSRRDDARFFMASTSEVYGDPSVHPQPESYWGNVNSIGPRSMYDEAKRFSEALTMAYHHTHGVDVRIVRIFNTYGPRMQPDDGRVVSNFITQALQNAPLTVYGDGSQTRSFCYVADEIRGFLSLLDGDHIGPINIGSPNEFTMLELAALVVELTGSTAGLVYEALPGDDPKQRKPDITLARQHLGWEPVVRLREGLGHTIPYFAQRLEEQG